MSYNGIKPRDISTDQMFFGICTKVEHGREQEDFARWLLIEHQKNNKWTFIPLDNALLFRMMVSHGFMIKNNSGSAYKLSPMIVDRLVIKYPTQH